MVVFLRSASPHKPVILWQLWQEVGQGCQDQCQCCSESQEAGKQSIRCTRKRNSRFGVQHSISWLISTFFAFAILSGCIQSCSAENHENHFASTRQQDWETGGSYSQIGTGYPRSPGQLATICAPYPATIAARTPTMCDLSYASSNRTHVPETGVARASSRSDCCTFARHIHASRWPGQACFPYPRSIAGVACSGYRDIPSQLGTSDTTRCSYADGIRCTHGHSSTTWIATLCSLTNSGHTSACGHIAMAPALRYTEFRVDTTISSRCIRDCYARCATGGNGHGPQQHLHCQPI